MNKDNVFIRLTNFSFKIILDLLEDIKMYKMESKITNPNTAYGSNH